MCEKLRLETGARLFEPEPAKKGNSNTGENLKQVTRYPKAAAKILDCSEQFIYLLHDFLGMLESLESQNADELEEMGKQVFELFSLQMCSRGNKGPHKKDVAQFSFRGSHKEQNLGCFKRNWAFSDPLKMEYAE